MIYNCLTIVVLLHAWQVLGYPHREPGDHFSKMQTSLLPRSNGLPTLLLPNATFPTPNTAIECFRPSPIRGLTSINGCRPTLNEFRNFPRYRAVQDFLENRWPRKPSEPPYALHHTKSDCLVSISSTDPRTIDRFSFEQIRQLATDILEECCQPETGYGGISPIGKGIGWVVGVTGFLGSDMRGNGSVYMEGIVLLANESVVLTN